MYYASVSITMVDADRHLRGAEREERSVHVNVPCVMREQQWCSQLGERSKFVTGSSSARMRTCVRHVPLHGSAPLDRMRD